MSDELEFWPERGEPLPQFALLAALYSELIAVTVSGQLYQWKWNEAEPYRHSEVCIHYSLKLRIAAQNVNTATLYFNGADIRNCVCVCQLRNLIRSKKIPQN